MLNIIVYAGARFLILTLMSVLPMVELSAGRGPVSAQRLRARPGNKLSVSLSVKRPRRAVYCVEPRPAAATARVQRISGQPGGFSLVGMQWRAEIAARPWCGV